MSMSKLVNVNNIPQLIDLNEDTVNFKLDFKVSSENNEQFNVVVASQLKLDSGEPLDFKQVDNGNISGSIIVDNGVKQNYYLVIKSDNPTKCTVELNLKEIPLNEKYIEEMQRNIYDKNQKSVQPVKSAEQYDNFLNKKSILFIVGIVCVIMFYYLFLRKSGNTSNITSTSELELPSVDNKLLSTITDNIPVISSNTMDLDFGCISDNNIPIFDSVKENLLLKLNSVQLY